MNKKNLLFLLILLPLLASAQTSRTIHVATAGTLSNYISEEEKYQIEELTLTGELNGTDFWLIRDMAGISYCWDEYGDFTKDIYTDGKLKSLNLLGVKIVYGGIYYEYEHWVSSNTTAGMSYITENNKLTSYLFYGCSGLTSITIPSSVTSIEDYAFSGCSGLTSVTIPNSVISIGGWAFSGCSGLTTIISEIEKPFEIYSYTFSDDTYNVVELIVPKGTKALYQATEGWNKFAKITEAKGEEEVSEFSMNGIRYKIGDNNNVSVTRNWDYRGDIVIPSQVIYNGKAYNVTSIEENAFNDCHSLTSVVIPNTVTTIGSSAFSACSALTSVNIPYGVTYIGDGAFSICDKISSISIPNSVTYIGEYAFWQCNIKSVYIPSSVSFIGDYVFYQCYNLGSITVDEGNRTYDSRNNCNAIIETATNTLVAGCKNTIISQGISSLGPSAFAGCRDLRTLKIPKSLTKVRYGFSGCNNLESIVVEDGNTIYDSRNNCNAIIETATNTLVAGCKNTIIPNGIRTIGQWAFEGITSLTSITIPESVTTIRWGAFVGCSGITSVNIPNSVTYIGGGAFDGCKMSSVIIPNSVTFLGECAFQVCSSLTSVTLSKNLKTIERGVFAACNNISTVISKMETPVEIEKSVFTDDVYEKAELIVPAGTKSLYEATEGWNKFTNIVEVGGVGYKFESDGIYYRIGENNIVYVISGETKYSGDIVIPNQVVFNGVSYSVTTIGYLSFMDCTGLTSITLPPSLTRIQEDAFKNCTNLTSVHISDLEAWLKVEVSAGGNDMRDWSSSPLYYAHHLYLNGEEVKSIEIPNTWTSIPWYYFEGWSGISSFTIPNSVTSIGYCSFSGCSGLTTITIPNSVTSIGWGAFIGCNGLTNIVSEVKNPFEIREVFDSEILANTTLIIPAGTKSLYLSTAGWNQFQNIVEVGGVGYEFENNGIRYKIGENNTVSVVSRDVKYSGDVVIPNQVSYNGSNYDVTSIGSSAFEGCVDMTAVTIPSSVTTIGGAAFYYCTGLTTVNIPNGVTTIGEGAFSKCEGLTSVTIPGSVMSIDKNAFFQCYGLTQITSGIENPFAIDDGVFPTSVYNNASLLVPSGKKSAYQNTAGWKRFQNIAEASVVVKEFESNGVRYLIGENNTVSVISKTEKYTGAVSIPNQVSFNGDNYTVTSIASSAFEGCVDMTSISIPGSVTTIGDAAFYYCTGLTNIDIPNGVKTIGEGAFSKCEGLTSVTIPGSVTSIGKNAFFQCYGLTQITSGIENPFAIDEGVFPTSVYNNASLLVPSGKKSAYQNTAGWKRFQNIYYVDGVYTLTYYVDGVEYKSVTYSSGAGITPETEPTKEGYTFSGWIDLPETMPDHDVTVTGTFTINQYTITYMIDGEVYATVTVDFNSKIVPLTPPSKDGFDFAWEEYPETMPAHDITINGAYTTTGILSIAVESGKAKIFTLEGRQVDTLQKGINIIRMEDGSIKKVVIK